MSNMSSSFQLECKLYECLQFGSWDRLWSGHVPTDTTNWPIGSWNNPCPAAPAQPRVTSVFPTRSISKHNNGGRGLMEAHPILDDSYMSRCGDLCPFWWHGPPPVPTPVLLSIVPTVFCTKSISFSYYGMRARLDPRAFPK